MNIISDPYSLLLNFLVLGAFLGLGYELLRVVRVFVHHNSFAIGLEDTVYLTFCGVVMFAFSMEIGNGQFRLYFAIGAVIGAVLYFLTVGRLINIILKFIVGIIKKIILFILKIFIKPIRKVFVVIKHILSGIFVHIYDFAKKVIKRLKHLLPNRGKMLYNNNTSDVQDNFEAGEFNIGSEKTTIKGKVEKR